jgi:putative transposase
MSRTRRKFSSQFKADLCVELLKGEKDLNSLASENSLLPNLLRNWKKDFLEKCSKAFDDTSENYWKEKYLAGHREKEDYARKVGQLAMQVDWLKKNLRRLLDQDTKTSLLQSLSKSRACASGREREKKLSVRIAAGLPGLNRTSIYYKHRNNKSAEEELACKALIDRIHTDNPSWGARQLSKQLRLQGFKAGRFRTMRFMREMGIDAIYPKMNLSKRQKKAQILPYLLKNADIKRPNQAWSIDITYIPIKHGFLYLTAIIDWYSRCIVGWEVDDTLDTRMVIQAVRKAFRIAKPEILNSDQGCQFTSNEYKTFLLENQVLQSMDGKCRWADNIMIERWFRSFRYEEAYLTQYNNIREAREAIRIYVKKYNFERCHSAIGGVPPALVYYPAMLLEAARAAA